MAFVNGVAFGLEVGEGRRRLACPSGWQRYPSSAPLSKRGPHHGRRQARLQVSCSATPTHPHPDSLEACWPSFAERMRASGEIPALEEWHALLDGCIRANDKPSAAVWVLNLLRETGVKPTAVTYEKVLAVCAAHQDRVAAFHLVEHMYQDKILLGDVELPDGMEHTLRAILPPEAFE